MAAIGLVTDSILATGPFLGGGGGGSGGVPKGLVGFWGLGFRVWGLGFGVQG